MVSHSARQHRRERVVAAPEMVVQRGRAVNGNQPEKKEPDDFVHFQELSCERAVVANQGWQLTEEEQVHSVAVRVGVEEPKHRARLGRHPEPDGPHASRAHAS